MILLSGGKAARQTEPKEVCDMNNWYDLQNMGISVRLSEDVGAPELRSPDVSGMRPQTGWLARLVKAIVG